MLPRLVIGQQLDGVRDDCLNGPKPVARHRLGRKAEFAVPFDVRLRLRARVADKVGPRDTEGEIRVDLNLEFAASPQEPPAVDHTGPQRAARNSPSELIAEAGEPGIEAGIIGFGMVVASGERLTRDGSP